MAQAVELLQKHGDRAKILAGGQSLIPLMKLRLAAPEVLVDIGRIQGLSVIAEEGSVLKIGALVRHADIERSALIARNYPLFADIPKVLGDPEVRNLGTVGGSVVHADPAGDWGTALLAADATLVATGSGGKRSIPVDAFFEDTFTTALQPAELLTEIRIPKHAAKSGGAYQKLKRKTGDFAIVSVAAQVQLGAEGTIQEGRIALGAVGPTAVRATRAEAALVDQAPGDAVFRDVGRAAAQESQPSSDLHGSADYKRAMVEILTRRALETAVRRAGA